MRRPDIGAFNLLRIALSVPGVELNLLNARKLYIRLSRLLTDYTLGPAIASTDPHRDKGVRRQLVTISTAIRRLAQLHRELSSEDAQTRDDASRVVAALDVAGRHWCKDRASYPAVVEVSVTGEAERPLEGRTELMLRHFLAQATVLAEQLNFVAEPDPDLASLASSRTPTWLIGEALPLLFKMTFPGVSSGVTRGAAASPSGALIDFQLAVLDAFQIKPDHGGKWSRETLLRYRSMMRSGELD